MIRVVELRSSCIIIIIRPSFKIPSNQPIKQFFSRDALENAIWWTEGNITCVRQPEKCKLYGYSELVSYLVMSLLVISALYTVFSVSIELPAIPWYFRSIFIDKSRIENDRLSRLIEFLLQLSFQECDQVVHMNVVPLEIQWYKLARGTCRV